MKFPINLKILRKRYDFTQERLATLVGVKNSTISNYEKGLSQPEFSTLLKFREIFQTDLETLVFGDVPENSNKMEFIPQGDPPEALTKEAEAIKPEWTEGIELTEGERHLYERLLKEKDVVIELLKQQIEKGQ